MLKVLLVDDSKIFQKVLAKIFAKEYAVIGTACDGREGFDKYKELQPDFVLLDITMPNCNGKECLMLIREFNPHAKVIMCSSLGDELTIQQCKSHGALGFVPKDVIKLNENQECPVLVQMINNILISSSVQIPKVA